jgi:hypothetical protein
LGTEGAGTGAVNPVQSIDFAIASSSYEEVGCLAQARRRRNLWIVGLGLMGLILKLVIAYHTVGTNDTVTFYRFAKNLTEHSLEWTYRRSISFNHPPLTAYYLRGIYALAQQSWCQHIGLTFPFLLRLPGIVADFVLILVLLRMSDPRFGLIIPTWAFALFTLSPVSVMVSGFHGNTDPVMVLFLLCAAFMCLQNRPALCGLFLALSCQVKIIPLLLLPIVFFFWFANHAAIRFAASFLLLCLTMWAEPLVKFPALFLRNVFVYGSYWGVWGITYCLRLTGYKDLNGTGAFNLPFAAAASALLLKVVIVSAVLLLAWRRRNLGRKAVINSIAYAWIIFFVLSPGICVQYLVWLAPFILLLSPGFYGCVLAASSIFAFVFYNTTAGGLPWSAATSTRELIDAWAPWSLLPWFVLIGGAIAFWRKNAQDRRSFRGLSLQTAPADSV